jgi:signal transduction histidine kinase
VSTAPVQPDPGMHLSDLLSDREFLNRSDDARRAARRLEAFQIIASVFTAPPEVVLQRLVDVAVDFCGADSAGISLEEPNEEGELRFRWIAIAGTFSKYLHGTTPRFFSPCGTCLSSGRPQHYRVTKPYYDFLGVTAEEITDGMLIPWTSDERRGTIWAISHGSPQTFRPHDYKLLSILASFVGISVRLTERAQRSNSLQQFSSDLMRVQDQEQRKLARELHDSMGQYLSALRMNLAHIRRGSKDVDPKVLADSEELVDQCLTETRTISHLLHPPLLNESGLRSAAKWYVEGFSQRSGIEVALEVDENVGRMEEDFETALFRVLQESLNNVHRHSQSKSVEIGIRCEGASVVTTVRDFGRGFAPQQLWNTAVGNSQGIGLMGLRERIAALGGTLELLPAHPGALVRVTLPYVSRKKATAQLITSD